MRTHSVFKRTAFVRTAFVRTALVWMLSSTFAVVSNAEIAQAQSRPPLPTLMPRRASIQVHDNEGLVALPLPREVLAESRPDLSDVRICDAQDREIPYLIDRGDRPLPTDVPVAISIAPLEALRERRSLRGITTYVERYIVRAPSVPLDRAHWVLRIGSVRPRFAHTVIATVIDDDGTEREIARGSFYRLGTPLREQLELELPTVAEERIRIELESQDAHLEPSFELITQPGEAAVPTIEIPLAASHVRTEAGRTILTVDAPSGVSPMRIVLTTSTASFVRPVEVAAIARGRTRRHIGGATVLRVENIPGAEALSIDVTSEGADSFEIVIHDGDSPPLEGLGVVAIAPQQRLLFEGRSARTLRFGGGRVRAPSYDLQALFGTSLGETLLDRHAPGVSVDPIENEPAFDPSPALSFAMRPGAEVEVHAFRSVAELTVPDAPEGLSRVVLPADVLAASREDLADLRIVSEDGRQWPYLVSSDVHLVSLPIDVERVQRGRPYWSVYRARMPVPSIVPSRIELEMSTAFVDREVRVVSPQESGGEITLGQAVMSRRPGWSHPLEISTQAIRTSALEIHVFDGDEAPLPLERVIARLPSHELFIVAPAGTYRVLTGHEDAISASYEIARARELILAVEAADATMTALSSNPSYRVPSLLSRAGIEALAVWIALVLAVVMLGVMTLRVARS